MTLDGAPRPLAVLGGGAWYPPQGPRWLIPAPDGRHLLVGGLGPAVARLDLETGAVVDEVETAGRSLVRAALGPEGRVLYLIDSSRALAALDLETGEERWRVAATPHPAALDRLAVTGDGRHVVTGDILRTVFVWNAATGRQAGPGTELPGALHGLVAAPRGRALAATYRGGGLKVWDRADRRELLAVEDLGPLAGADALAFTGEGARVWVGTADEPRLRAYELADGGPPCLELDLAGPPGEDQRNQVVALAPSPDGRRLAALTRLEIMVLDAADGAVQARWRWDRSGLPEGETLARLLAFSRDGRTLWTRGYSERLWGWPAGGGPPVNPYAGHRQGVDRMALSRDGRELTVLGLDHRSHAWDVDAARPGDGRATPPFPPGLEHPPRWTRSPDGELEARVAVGQVTIHRVGVDDPLQVLAGPVAGSLTPVGFFPDGRRLVAQGPGGVLLFWSLATGALLHRHHEPALAELEGPGGPLRVSPMGERLVTRGPPGRVLLLELRRHHPREADEALRVAEVRDLPVTPGMATLLAFSGDGTRLAVGTWSQREVRVYALDDLLAMPPRWRAGEPMG